MRYEAAIATLIGVLALLVSAYTAYMQRQQVRAQVWPMLELQTGNRPTLRFMLANKGVGPALIRHVVITVDGKPVTDWDEALQRIFVTGKHHFGESDIHRRVLSAGETLEFLFPSDDNGAPLAVGAKGSLGDVLDHARHDRLGFEICYCSTLGDCWTLRAAPEPPNGTTETRRCPAPSERTFQQ
jgi:hypothetical protein